MKGDITPYLNLIPSANQKAPNFVAMVAATLQPCADLVALSQSVQSLFDLDTAVGQQLDWIGQWVGLSRGVSEAIPSVYFSFDSAPVGFDLGVWLGPGDPTTDLVSLPDSFYCLVLAAKILNNTWDGTIAKAYALMDVLFLPLGYQLLIQDNNDLSMTLILISNTNSSTLDFVNDSNQPLQFVNNSDQNIDFYSSYIPPLPPLLTALLKGGYLGIKPLGVGVDYAVGIKPIVPGNWTSI